MDNVPVWRMYNGFVFVFEIAMVALDTDGTMMYELRYNVLDWSSTTDDTKLHTWVVWEVTLPLNHELDTKQRVK